MDRETDDPTSKTKLTIDMPRRRPRGFLIALLVLAALFVLGALVLYLLPHFLPIDTIRGIAKTKARELAGVDVDFGNLSFGWNGDVVVDEITVAPLTADGRPGDRLLAIQEVRTNIALTPLLSGKAIVNSISINGFAATVRRGVDGKLNIPDFANLPVPEQASLPERQAARSAMLLSAPLETEAETAPEATAEIPPIEIHRLELNQGALSYNDETQNLDLTVGLDFLRVEGKTLDDPFVLSGRLLPYPEDPSLGDLPFTGRVAVLKGGQFDPSGEATLDAQVMNLSLARLAAKFNLGDLVRAARTNGDIAVQYTGGKIAVNIPEFRVEGAKLGLAPERELAIPDSTASLNALFDSQAGTLALSEVSVMNDIAALRGQGEAAGVNALAEGGFPTASVAFSGSLDLTRAAEYAETQNLGLDGLPEIQGKASFTGETVLPARNADGSLAPTLTVNFNDGEARILDAENGTALAAMDLKGLGVRAAATLADVVGVNASVSLAGVPARGFIPGVPDEPVSLVLNGGAAVAHSPQGTVAEVRFENTRASIPATPWSGATTLNDAGMRLRFDLNRDQLQIDSLRAAVGNAARGGVTSGAVSGILAGSPSGQIDLEFTGVVEQIASLLSPVVPKELVAQIAGSLRGAARVKMNAGKVETLVRSELTNSRGILTPAPDSKVEFQTPRTTLSALANLDLANPETIALQSLEASLADTAVRMTDAAGGQMSGAVGAGLLKAAGMMDARSMEGRLTGLSVDVNGMNLAMGQNGRQTAALTSGLMKVVAATPEQTMRLPLAGEGDFAVPNIDLGVDNLVFKHNDGESNLGNVRAKVAADGYIGTAKRQIINLRTASLAAAPLAMNSRGQLDLGSGAFLSEYAARAAPSGLAALLAYLGLPPSLLTDAAVTGTVAYNGNQINSKGAAQGRLQTGAGETSPFEMAHDLSVLLNPAEQSVAIEIRRLDGSVKTPAGEAVAAMTSQPSKLLLSATGSKGLLDIRFNGSAAPSRQLALGLAAVVPQMADLANTVSGIRADGVYNAWLQMRDLDPATLSINIGGEWQGAALSIAGTPYLAEAEKLSANIVGELALQARQLRLSRLLLRSDSGMMQADGTAAVTYTAGADNIPTGLANLAVDTRFVMADLQKAAMVFPGVLGGLGMTGRIDGAFTAEGDARNIDIAQAAVNFRQFAAPDMGIAVPSGAAAFDGLVSLHAPYDAITAVELRNGTASMRGLQYQGKAVNEMAAAFNLTGGVLTLDSAKVSIGDGSEGSVQAQGTVDFTTPDPAVRMRLALQNIPLNQANSELEEYMQFESGNINLPAQTGQAFGVSFRGLDEDSILRTLALENFTFRTGKVVMETGPALNAELDKARAILKQNKKDDETRVITFERIEGSANAQGNGTITIPESAPVNLFGADTGDFRAQGTVSADHTMNMRVMVAGKIGNLIGFTLPNIIPNLPLAGNDTGNRLMDALNKSAAEGKYGVNVSGALESPDISGIGALAGQFLQDILKSQLLDGVLDLGKDAPKALLNLGEQVVDGLTHPGETLKNAPEKILKSPENLVKGIGGMFGLGGGQRQEEQPQEGQEQPRQEQQQQPNPREAVRNLGRMFGIN